MLELLPFSEAYVKFPSKVLVLAVLQERVVDIGPPLRHRRWITGAELGPSPSTCCVP